MHARVVDEGGLVQIDVQPVIALELKGGLYGARAGKALPLVVMGVGLVHQRGNFAEAALGVVILLRVPVAGDPVGGGIAGHGELGQLIRDGEVGQLFLHGELVA